MADYRTLSNLQEVLSDGHQAVCIFKHSSTCPISGFAKSQVDSFLQGGNRPPVYLVTVQKERPLSNEIAAATKVRHESPQFLILRDGVVKAVLNHHNITADAIERELANA